VNFLIPERGKKKDLIDYAIKNTKLSLNTHISESISNEKILNDLSNALGIRNKINRIETYDNSHLFGKNAVGAMIVFNKNGFDKTAYRKFNINHENITPGDDYGMMRQVLKRRFSERAVKDKKKYINSPQLILIDGGKGHYEVAINVLKELNIKDIRVMSMFKGNGRKAEFDKIIFKNKINFIQKNTSEFFFLQRLRDESHRFAIGAHRNKNKKDIKNSELEPINGLGRARRKNLMNYFGSIQSIKTASSSDLEKVDGISKTMSEKIYNYFNN
jgi:excinuclease ABC subunit C